MTPPVSHPLPTKRVKPVKEFRKAKPQDNTVMKKRKKDGRKKMMIDF